MLENQEQKGTTQKSDELPVWESYKVLDYVTIFKSDKWWEAIALIESYGKRFIAMYMWNFKDEKWKRKHKFHIKNLDEWNNVKNAVEKFLHKLAGDK